MFMYKNVVCVPDNNHSQLVLQDQHQAPYDDRRQPPSQQASYRDNSRQPSYHGNQPGYQAQQAPPQQQLQPNYQARYQDTSRQSSYRDSRQPGFPTRDANRQPSYNASNERVPSNRGSQAGSAQPTPSMQRRPEQGQGGDPRAARQSPWLQRKEQSQG